jgi:CRISPR/Cas system CSM-associated protein Csm3 (group 7 of RAMP superfamily)
MHSINIQCLMTTLEDFHLGTGTGNIGLFDDAQYRDQGVVSIRENSLKGVLKDSCRQINQYHKGFADGNEPAYDKIYKRIFESHSDLHSLDIHITPISPEDSRDQTVIHYFTSINPESGTAQTNTLRSLEFGAKSLSFRIDISYLCRDNGAEEIKAYLVEALQNIKSIGGHRRRGFGAIHISDIKAAVTPLEVSSIAEKNKGTDIKLILELQEDALISAKAQSGNMLETNDYITGTTILGMLRAKLMSLDNKSSYLDDDAVKASFFYPMPRNVKYDDPPLVHPVFMSLRKKKDYILPDQEQGRIPVWALSVASSKQNKLVDILSHNTLHTDIEHGDPSKGLYDGYLCTAEKCKWDNAEYYKVNKRIHQRNHIDSSTQRTKDGGVFVESRIEKGTSFIGYLHFNDEQSCSDFCRDFSPWLSGTYNLNVGRGAKPCKIRSYKILAQKQSAPCISLKDEKFNVSFISDVILFDDKLRPVRHFDEEALADALGESYTKDDFILERYSERNGIISSFSGTTGLRRFRDITLKKGSSYSFRLADATKAKQLEVDLLALENSGIGFKQNEGFGTISINHPIHDIKQSQEQIEKTAVKTEVSRNTMNLHYVPRLTATAQKYVEADELCSILGKPTEKVKWKRFAFKIINLINEDDDRDRLNSKLQDIEEVKNNDWDDSDYRKHILRKILESSCRAASVRIALLLILTNHGGKINE